MHPCFCFPFLSLFVWTSNHIHCISACIPVVVLALSSSFTWLCKLIFSRPHKVSVSFLLLPLRFSFFFFFSFTLPPMRKQCFSIKIFLSLLSWSGTLPVTWADRGLCLFLEWVNTSLSFGGGKPRSSCTFLTSVERIKLLKVQLFRACQFCTGQRRWEGLVSSLQQQRQQVVQNVRLT